MINIKREGGKERNENAKKVSLRGLCVPGALCGKLLLPGNSAYL